MFVNFVWMIKLFMFAPNEERKKTWLRQFALHCYDHWTVERVRPVES